MKQKLINVYTIEELDKKAKEKAYNDFIISDIYPFDYENRKSLKEFSDVFMIANTDYEYGYTTNISYNFNEYVSDDIAELKGPRLSVFLWNNFKDYIYNYKDYSKAKKNSDSIKFVSRKSNITIEKENPFTGYYMDSVLLEPIWDMIDNPYKYPDKTYSQLILECLNGWVVACSKDYTDYCSFDNFVELSELNEWYYLSNGDFDTTCDAMNEVSA